MMIDGTAEPIASERSTSPTPTSPTWPHVSPRHRGHSTESERNGSDGADEAKP